MIFAGSLLLVYVYLNVRKSSQEFHEPRRSFMLTEYSGNHNSHILLNSLNKFQIKNNFNFYMRILWKKLNC